jgi:catechol 2,3-dioxygenase-like lactoylglutathione lyase family enzyme
LAGKLTRCASFLIKMPIERIDHVQLAMPAGAEDLARQFYSGLLGIPEVSKPPDLAKRGGVWFESGMLKVHLGVDPEFRPARKAHVGLIVRDLPGLLSSLRAAGVAVSEDDGLPGYHRAYADDPFGNRLELIEGEQAWNSTLLQRVDADPPTLCHVK